jgi:hypothetical protein
VKRSNCRHNTSIAMILAAARTLRVNRVGRQMQWRVGEWLPRNRTLDAQAIATSTPPTFNYLRGSRKDKDLILQMSLGRTHAAQCSEGQGDHQEHPSPYHLKMRALITLVLAVVVQRGAHGFVIDAAGRLEGETCAEKCVVAGHCCIGNSSACQKPSCQMGCTLGNLVPSFAKW